MREKAQESGERVGETATAQEVEVGVMAQAVIEDVDVYPDADLLIGGPRRDGTPSRRAQPVVTAPRARSTVTVVASMSMVTGAAVMTIRLAFRCPARMVTAPLLPSDVR